jgi:arylamine N-acetyltransferase
MNLAISLDPAGLFTNVLICANVDYNGLDAISRNILVNDRFKKREKGETTEDVTFKNEQERIQKLKDQFGIELTPDEVEGIKGRRTAMEVFDPDTVPIDIFAAFS